LQKVIYIVILVVSIYGCSASRKAEKTVIENEVSVKLTEEVIQKRNLTNLNFTIQRADIELNNDGTIIKLLASLKYVTNGKYLISVRSKSGIEVVRIIITNDTIQANDRITKKLYFGSTGFLESKYGISIGSLPVLLGDLIIQAGRLQGFVECQEGKGIIRGTPENENINYSINCEKQKVEQAILRTNTGSGIIDIRFSNYRDNEKLSYPGTIEMIEEKSKSVVKIEIKKVEFNTDDNLKFIPGVNYEKIMLK
jgi:hypothetical protein